MKTAFFTFGFTLCFFSLFAQNYRREEVCAPDTIVAPAIITKTGEIPAHRFIKCTRVSKIGLRIEAGFNTYAYSSKTKSWLGNHNGGSLGLSVAWRDFNIGVRFKPATVNPGIELTFGGNVLPQNASLNPIKIDYDISYSVNLKYNISIEPYAAITSHQFAVINEEELNRHYSIPGTTGLTIGTTVNKYIRVKDIEFVALFARYGYGFTSFAKTNSNLGRGYSDFSFGVAYKGFFKRKLFRNV